MAGVGAPRHPVDVLLILTRGERVLLAERAGTGYADGRWNLPSGKLEAGEDALAGMVREAREEIGLRLFPYELTAVATVHHRSPGQDGRLGLVFAVELEVARHGEPVNAEPHKCARIGWFEPGRLPAETYPYSAACLRAYRDGVRFTLSGW
jgi:8-oxo-dGTP pyrophosphatase MutT (NUDIX family)